MQEEMNVQNERGEDTSKQDIQLFLTFYLEGEEYGVDVMQVMEIRGWSETTKLPNTPDFIMGVINLRGTVIPILDIRRRFGMTPATLSDKSVVIILSSPERSIGILVDSVSGILEVTGQNIKPPPPMTYSIEDSFLSGIVSLDSRMVILLSAEKLFSLKLLEQECMVAEQEGKVGNTESSDK